MSMLVNALLMVNGERNYTFYILFIISIDNKKL